MKFVLIMMVCSQTLQICTKPQEVDFYNNYFNCSSSGYLKAYELNQVIGEDRVKKELTIINFECKKINNI
mgnify:CR=1 FL=1|tara:strand:+ start:96 stop:305 length:210 start_codon:yes stop_codon:yes gene_type:complete